MAASKKKKTSTPKVKQPKEKTLDLLETIKAKTPVAQQVRLLAGIYETNLEILAELRKRDVRP